MSHDKWPCTWIEQCTNAISKIENCKSKKSIIRNRLTTLVVVGRQLLTGWRLQWRHQPRVQLEQLGWLQLTLGGHRDGPRVGHRRHRGRGHHQCRHCQHFGVASRAPSLARCVCRRCACLVLVLAASRSSARCHRRCDSIVLCLQSHLLKNFKNKYPIYLLLRFLCVYVYWNIMALLAYLDQNSSKNLFFKHLKLFFEIKFTSNRCLLLSNIFFR